MPPPPTAGHPCQQMPGWHRQPGAWGQHGPGRRENRWSETRHEARACGGVSTGRADTRSSSPSLFLLGGASSVTKGDAGPPRPREGPPTSVLCLTACRLRRLAGEAGRPSLRLASRAGGAVPAPPPPPPPPSQKDVAGRPPGAPPEAPNPTRSTQAAAAVAAPPPALLQFVGPPIRSPPPQCGRAHRARCHRGAPLAFGGPVEQLLSGGDAVGRSGGKYPLASGGGRAPPPP